MINTVFTLVLTW